MTEKRFTLAYEDYDWWAICDKENPTELGISGLDVVELLNELHEENRELQRHLDVMISGALTDDKRIKELYGENEQLKQEKQLLYENIDFLKKIIEKQGFKVRLDSDVEMIKCKDYGLKCLKCPYWNHWTNFCTKWKITTSTSGGKK